METINRYGLILLFTSVIMYQGSIMLVFAQGVFGSPIKLFLIPTLLALIGISCVLYAKVVDKDLVKLEKDSKKEILYVKSSNEVSDE
ncbi:hypothetical protein [Caldalkalibacillus salinus]|uniref:hypothetical protein n=1 Tax=Caldalkalibacillus salinus TaxID=2803787 RepID=UPI001924B1F2|nr:hypothetical protein [Caldalkalibacillus salinus]